MFETGRVIFFPLKFIQSEENLRTLSMIQEKLTLAHAEIAFQYRDKPRWAWAMGKIRYHQGFRDRLLVYPGLKGTLLFRVLEGKG